MWLKYGNNDQGFSVGFNTVELARNLACTQNVVNYCDKIPVYDLLLTRQDTDFSPYYLKSKDWKYEKEYRFITMGVESNNDRTKIYPLESVVEVLLGRKFPENQKLEFLDEVRKIFSKEIPIYQVRSGPAEIGLEKIRID